MDSLTPPTQPFFSAFMVLHAVAVVLMAHLLVIQVLILTVNEPLLLAVRVGVDSHVVVDTDCCAIRTVLGNAGEAIGITMR